MSFQPVIPFGGMAGWAFLQRTRADQQQAFEKSSEFRRDTDYFAANIGKITSAEALVKDYRLLKVALGAFGLDDDIGNKFFIQKVLEEGAVDRQSLANKMTDKRYLDFTKAFGFGDLPVPNTQLSDFADTILDAHAERQFEIAVGEQDNDLRLSLALERDLTSLVKKNTTADGMWFSVFGNPPLRKVFETALGLPSSIGALDLDLQLASFRARAKATFGDSEIAQFSDPDKRAELNRMFLVRAQINDLGGGLSSASIALNLLQNA